MRVALMQPYFLPYLGYWQLIGAVDLFVYYDDVTFIKQGWINRNRILLKGAEHMFTLHVKGASSFTPIKDVSVGDNRGKLHKTISQAYAKAPFFRERQALLEKLFSSDESNLVDHIEKSHQHILDILGIKATVMRSSQLQMSVSGKGQDRVIQICRELGATSYINSIGGRELYSKTDFASAGINLRFLQPVLTPYSQNIASFIQGLSILDVLMFNGTPDAIAMLGNFQLIE